ncbi:MAG: futalosine hydrolase [Bacteroidales bacterium]|jgi:futalosine hydrolase|nr:futalosine hydrolase [Bacteroidales bacterium]
MPRKILFVTATDAEADAVRMAPGMKTSGDKLICGGAEISILVTGIGSVATAWGMSKWLASGEKPDIAVNAGIAGSFSNLINIGDVVLPFEDCFADAGIEEGNAFLTLGEAGLDDPDRFPFRNGRIYADSEIVKKMSAVLKPVRAVTVNCSSGSELTIAKLLKKFNPEIETMEGAAFFYICSREEIPFLALRSISNRIELRNRKNWNIRLALDNLSEKLNEIFLFLTD